MKIITGIYLNANMNIFAQNLLIEFKCDRTSFFIEPRPGAPKMGTRKIRQEATP